MTYEIRLRAYEPGTDTVLGLLPDALSWDASVVHNNDGALTLKASQLADGGAFISRTLNDGLDVALEVNLTGAPDGWVEPDNCRYLMVDRSKDPTDPAKVYDLTLPSWSWLMNKVCDLNTGALQGAKSKYAGQRLFPATSDAGDVVKKMLDEHDARPGPAVPIVRSSWSTTKDSNGNDWAKKLGKNTEGRAFPAGQPLHARLDALTTNRKCDWRTRGRGLRIYNPNTAFLNRSATVHLRLGDDLVDAPSKTSQADRVARLLVKGDGKHKVTVKDPTIPEHYGRWEGMLDCAGVKDDDDLEDAGQAELDTRNRIKGQYTYTLTMAGGYLPFRDYNIGDLVKAPGDGADEVLQVMQITISRDSKGVLGGNVVLGDRFTAKGLATASRVQAITGGTSGVSGNGTTTQPEAPDTRQAATPTGFTVSPSLLLVDRRWRVKVDLSWDAVTLATDGTALTVSGYRVWGQPAGGEWRQLTTTAATALSLMDFAQGSTWTFGVSAVPESAQWESGIAFSSAVTLPADTTPPNKPSDPVVESQPATVSVTWDGLDYLGGAMPGDFDRVDVRMGTTNPPTEVVAQMAAGGQYVALAEIHSTVWVQLVAYDTTGNPSVATTPVSVVVKSVLDDTDLADRLATSPRFYTSPDHTPPATDVPAMSWWLKADGTVWQYVSGAWVPQANAVTGSVTAAQVLALLMAAASATIGDLSADSATIQNLYAQAFTAATAAIGLVRADRIIAGAIDGFVITGATVRTAASGARVELNSTGLHGYNSSNVEKTKVGTDGKLVATDADLSGKFTNTSATGSAVIDGGVVNITDATGNTGVTVSVGPYSAQLTENGTLFKNGSVATANFGVAGSGDTLIYSLNDLIMNGATDVYLQTSGAIRLDGLLKNNPPSYSGSANAIFRGAGGDGMRDINIASSLRAVKALIEDLDTTPEAVLNLRPRTWFDKGEMLAAGLDPDTATEADCLAAGLRRIPGLVAEEVQATDPLFVIYDRAWLDDGVDGVAASPVPKLQGVAYDRISAALLVLAKSQQAQIEDLATRMAALESRLPPLEA